VIEDLLEIVVYGAILVGRLCLSRRYPASRDDDTWTRTDLSKVPPVIVQPEPRGHVLPWYRRVLRRAPHENEAPRELTTYRT